MMRSERVLVKLVDKPLGWVGDDVRFRINSGDADVRASQLKEGFRQVAQTQIVASEDLPNFTYDRGMLVPYQTRASVGGYVEIIPDAEPFNVGPALVVALIMVAVLVAAFKYLL